MKKLGFWILFGFMILMLGFTAEAATYTVTNTNDSGAGSLRQAITDAVGNIGADTIEFNIPPSDGGYVTVGGVSYWRIRPTSVLPVLDQDPSGSLVATSIDGTTQATNGGDTNPLGPEIMIDGTIVPVGADLVNGLNIATSSCLISGLIINNFSGSGIAIGSGASVIEGNQIYGCYLGVDATGEVAAANNVGINIILASQDNIIGSSESSKRNIISGNTNNGIVIDGIGNKIFGNYIGVNRSGISAIANGASGIVFGNNTGTNEVGGTNSGEGNIISGNGGNGITLDQSVSNSIFGNYIGTSSNGASSIPNNVNGIFVHSQSIGNNIGDGTTAGRNIISGNIGDGINFNIANSNQIKGNYIGVDVNGTTSLGNGGSGVSLGDSSSNEVEENVVSGNTASGVHIGGGYNNNILGNYIGLDSTGLAAIGNGVVGIYLGGGSIYNNIGDGTAAGRNVFSANGDNGIEMADPGTNSNEVNNNYVGTDVNGDSGTGFYNSGAGIYIASDTKYNKVFSSRVLGEFVGIVFANGSSGYEISNNVIIGEGATDSKGILLEDNGEVGTATISSNEVRGFQTGIDINISSEATLNLNHNTVVRSNNPTGNGVGIGIGAGTVNISNCIIATNPTGIGSSDSSVGIQLTGGTVALSYSDVYGNNSNYQVDAGTLTTIATIHSVALFEDSDNDDYRLSYNSPCINTGTPEGVDMGAYQYTGTTPEVRVLVPNGNENWQEESSQTITWYASSESFDVTSIDLYYSTDSGTNYTAIATGLTNTGSYLWTLPNADSTNVRVRVVANGATLSSSDESDADFTISSKFVQVQGEVMTRPTMIKPQQGETTTIAYNLTTFADVRIILISKYGRVHWNYFAPSGSEGGKAGYNEVAFDGRSILLGETVPNGIYMIKLVSQNRVIGTGHIIVID